MEPWKDLNGKVVMVTGASSGIGREFCLDLANAGCSIIAAARRVDKLKSLCDEINSKGPRRAIVVQLDVTADGAAIETAVHLAWDAFGHIDALVNNAGLTGAWLVSKYVCRRMRDAKQGGGSVINISSIAGLNRIIIAGTLAYASSKMALSMLTKMMALELGIDNIRVNSIAPGVFKSEITESLMQKKWLPNVTRRTVPLRTFGTTDPALISVVRYLIHDSSEYVSGNVFIVDAGTSLPASSSRRKYLRKLLHSSIFSPNRLDAGQHLRARKIEELIAYCRQCSQYGTPVDIGQVTSGTLGRRRKKRRCQCNINGQKSDPTPVSGSDSSSAVLEWAMLELMKNPETMKRAKAELAEVVGENKTIEEKDVGRLPYLQCIMKETLRIHPPSSLLTRKAEQDVELCGYFVPKGSQVLVNVWAIGRDPDIWEDPLVFKPERFWDSINLDFHDSNFELIPFGVGRRMCVGLPLAIRAIPAMLGSLLNSFDWTLEENIAPKDLEEKFGLILAKSHPLRLVPIPLYSR
ncbi:hypothetical protein KY285_010232 [Solanum tuberosum]|nr:hypothetical protein KY289_010768 [Solanum tuberosum]KAH0734525.1 hypothetical protein KY285_010232 [Solanum tuberosum]